jgi:serine/threonine protein kinase
VLSDRFDIERELGRGGMGTVYLAHDELLDRSVAIKLLSAEVSSAIGSDRFHREIHLTARLVHPNIVPLFDSGESDGSLYYVMPFLNGGTLRERLSGSGPLPPADVIHVLSDLSEALAYSHGMGVIHRDLKPENVFWYGGRAILADFGIALNTETTTGALTQAGLVLGTSSYMSPEQASGERPDGRADLYSMGCVAFELLTGRPPYTAQNTAALLAAHVLAPIPSVRAIRPEVDPRLDGLCRNLMAKAPESRPASAAAVLDVLRELHNSAEHISTVARAVSPTRKPRRELPEEVTQLIAKGRELSTNATQGGEATRPRLEMARVYLEKACDLMPSSSEAMTQLAGVLMTQAARGFVDREEGFRRVRELLLSALALDDDLGEVHSRLGIHFLYWEDDFEEAGRELRRGVELSPGDAFGRRFYAVWLKIAGRLNEALEQMRIAADLAPRAAFQRVGLGDILMALGRYDESIAPLREALRLAPGYEAALERLEMSCHRAGRHDEALDARRMLLGVRGEHERAALLLKVVGELGWAEARERDLRRDIAALEERAKVEDPFAEARTSRQLADRLIILHAELGEWTRAMDWVERSYYNRPGRLRRVLTDFPYDHHGLARDSRYARLLRTAGLAELLG